MRKTTFGLAEQDEAPTTRGFSVRSLVMVSGSIPTRMSRRWHGPALVDASRDVDREVRARLPALEFDRLPRLPVVIERVLPTTRHAKMPLLDDIV